MTARTTVAGSVVVTDTDAAAGDEGFVGLHAGKNHVPYHATPPPIPHPEPGPRGRRPVPTGGLVKHAH